MKRMLLVVMSVVIFLCCSVSAYAALPGDGTTIQPMYNYINKYDTQLSISNKVATCSVNAQGYTGTTTKIEIDLTLQKKTALWWSTVEAWEVNYLQATALHSRTFSVGSGTYRLKAVYKVYSGTNYETITDYSSNVSC